MVFFDATGIAVEEAAVSQDPDPSASIPPGLH